LNEYELPRAVSRKYGFFSRDHWIKVNIWMIGLFLMDFAGLVLVCVTGLVWEAESVNKM